MIELGYGEDVYKLAVLNSNQRFSLINQLKVLPGHKAKLMSLFDVIDEVNFNTLINAFLVISKEDCIRITEAVYTLDKPIVVQISKENCFSSKNTESV